mmetsp:Transcript_22671/g.59045  ORF Transcript_22671/g.59045 Transcript_22671/m.59045 type:complete len:239 (+) Transcript_22671:538-1254(+)
MRRRAPPGVLPRMRRRMQPSCGGGAARLRPTRTTRRPSSLRRRRPPRLPPPCTPRSRGRSPRRSSCARERCGPRPSIRRGRGSATSAHCPSARASTRGNGSRCRRARRGRSGRPSWRPRRTRRRSPSSSAARPRAASRSILATLGSRRTSRVWRARCCTTRRRSRRRRSRGGRPARRCARGAPSTRPRRSPARAGLRHVPTTRSSRSAATASSASGAVPSCPSCQTRPPGRSARTRRC